MTDKVQKIREEVERRLEDAKAGVRQNQNRVKLGIDNNQDLVIWQHLESMAVQLLAFIDYLQEEPKHKFKVGDCIRPIDSCLGSQRTICEVCDSWYVTNQGTLDFEYEDNWELVEDSVHHTKAEVDAAMQDVEEKSKAFTDAHKGESAEEILAQMTNKEAIKYLQQLYPNGGHCWLDDQRMEAIGMAINALQEKPVSESLEKAATKYAQDKYMPVQTSQAFKSGANWQKEQMMANAIDVEVKLDAGGYPYIPQMELYDYDKDVPLAKAGDKYKVVLIRED